MIVLNPLPCNKLQKQRLSFLSHLCGAGLWALSGVLGSWVQTFPLSFWLDSVPPSTQGSGGWEGSHSWQALSVSSGKAHFWGFCWLDHSFLLDWRKHQLMVGLSLYVKRPSYLQFSIAQSRVIATYSRRSCPHIGEGSCRICMLLWDRRVGDHIRIPPSTIPQTIWPPTSAF